MTKGTVAIIEDDTDLQFIYRMVAESRGYTVAYTAGSCDKAVEEYKRCQSPPDLLIIDNRLYDSSGIDAAKDILNVDPNARFLFATSDLVIESADELNMVGVLHKPFSIYELASMMNKAMDKGRVDIAN